MKPIQLWLPSFLGGVARPDQRADMQRLFMARTVEQVMWAVSGWAGPPSWTQHGIPVGCINGQTIERARILHVGENGAVVGPAAAAFPNQSVSGLLDAWLNEEFVVAVRAKPGEPLHVKIPHPAPGGVALVDVQLPVLGAHHFPIKHLSDDQLALAQWPPRPDMPVTVSPELESAQQAADASKNTLHLRPAWLAPFDELQPLRISPDDLIARDRMRLIAEDCSKKSVKALAQAKTEAREWISDCQATVKEAWLKPIFASEGEEGALIAIESRYGVAVDSLDQAYRNRELREHLSVQIPVTRVWGVPGLMWALLLDRLSSDQPYRSCERCGRLVSGRGHKRFCSALDNPACFHDRKAEDKRRHRTRELTRSSRR